MKHARPRKAVIPVAGLGTRFLPATKSIPKEMLPIVDRPILLLIVEEAVRAGIEDIVLVAGRGKTAIEDFFDVSYELEDKLIRDGKSEWVENLKRIRNLANVISIRQMQPLGLGHAIGCARPIVGDQPFAVLLGDEIMVAGPHEKTVTEQLADGFESTGLSTVAMMEVPESETHKYGIVEGTISNSGGGSVGVTRVQVQNVIEKPTRGQSTSRWALPGRYVFDAAIFQHIADTKPGRNGEIQLTDAMVAVARTKGMIATSFQSRRYDAGDKFGYLQANIELGLEHPEVGAALKAYLKNLGKTL